MRQDAIGRIRTPDPPAPREGLPDPVVTAFVPDRPLRRACYRYRTAALVGPWRARPDQAQGDAVHARQAAFDDAKGFVWTVDGSIEMGCPPVEDEADPRGWSAH